MAWSSAGRKDLEEAFVAEGHSLIYPPFSIEEKTYRDLPEVERLMASLLHEEAPDIAFSVNYYPAISNLCEKYKLRYVSWTYDSPYRRLYSVTVTNPCNVIYVFDKELYLEFHNAGIKTVHYLPLAANTERLDAIGEAPSDSLPYLYDVSFLGSLYVEDDGFINGIFSSLSDFTKGYLDALMAAQLKIQGYNFIEDVLGPVLDDLSRACPIEHEPGCFETKEYYYANYIINHRITAVERIDLLDAIARNHTVDFFTQYKGFSLPNLRNHGFAEYYHQMPRIFKQSKINLNITLRGMKSGIPLRAIDIMGCGGFLISNFQSGFLEHFVPGEDFVYYESKEDLLQKIDYYLEHEEERKVIARNGHDKVAAEHTYRHRVREMLGMLGG